MRRVLTLAAVVGAFRPAAVSPGGRFAVERPRPLGQSELLSGPLALGTCLHTPPLHAAATSDDELNVLPFSLPADEVDSEHLKSIGTGTSPAVQASPAPPHAA